MSCRVEDGLDTGYGIVAGEECGDDGAELLGLLQMRAVTGIGEHVAFDVGDVLDIRLPGGGGGLVELACDDERGRGDLVQAVDDAPAAQRAPYVKLVGAVHGVVDRRFRLHLRDGVNEVLWRRNDT